jgi:PAS domain S-box-containing protein
MLEQSLSESLRYKKAVDTQAIVVVTDPKGKITYVNERFCEIAGYSQFELLGQTSQKWSTRAITQKSFGLTCGKPSKAARLGKVL